MNFLSNWMQSEWVRALGWTFVHSIWQIAVIGLLLFIILRLIPGRSAHVRYTISTFALWSMIIMALATFIVMLPDNRSVTEISGNIILMESGGRVLSITDRLSLWLESRMPMMLTVWMGGVMILMLRLAFSLVWIGHMRTTSTFSQAIQDSLDDIVRKFQLRIKPMVSESLHVSSPVTIGHLKPLILFPVGIINQLDPREVEAILTHELAHIVRRDYLSNLVQSFIETLFYYHPVTWWISRVVRTERENRADDLAVSWYGDHLVYAKTLMTVQEMQVQQGPALAIGFASRKGAMLARIQRILHIPYKNHNQMEKTVLLSLCSICFLAFTLTGNAKNENETKKENPFNELMGLIQQAPDTIPSSGTYRIHKKTDEQEINIEVEDGDIKELEIDGKEIDPQNYEAYDAIISDLFGEMTAPPVMEGFNFEMPPIPPMPEMPYMPGLPPLPPMPEMPDMSMLEKLELEHLYNNGQNIFMWNGENLRVLEDSTGEGMPRIIIIRDGDSSVIACPPGAYGFNFKKGMAPEIALELEMNKEQWKEQAHQWKEQAKEWENHKKAMKEQLRDNIHHYRMDAQQLEELQHNLREAEGLYGQLDEERARGRGYALRAPRLNMQDAMIEEGLVEPGEEAIIQLTPDKLKINGKKMDDETHERYLRMYEAQQGVELTGNSRVEFKLKSRRSM